MLTKDIGLFFVVYLICIAVSFILQIVVIRLINPKTFFMQLLGLPFLSVLVASIACFLFLSNQFSSMNVYYLANLGAGMAAVFSFGLYTLAGPITADRSTAAQMIILLYQTPQGFSPEELLKKFNGNNLLEKRYEECIRGKIIVDSRERIILTSKGKFVAKLYLCMLKCLNLSNKPQYKDYFDLAVKN